MMSLIPAITRWVTHASVVLVLVSAQVRASAPVADDPGYRDVTVNKGGKSAVIRVKDSVGPRLHGGQDESGGPYNPESMDLGRTSSFSNKEFSLSQSALSKNGTAREAQTGSFLTKAYGGVKMDSTSDFGRKYKTTTFADSSRGKNDFQKSFATSASDITQDKDTSFASKTSPYQGKSAFLDSPKTAPFSGNSDLANKTFSDPELTHVKRDPYAAATGLDVARMVDLPNRPLTIDEVRNLINHDTRPHLDEEPDAPSKPLNDRNWEPETQPPLAHEKDVPLPPDEKDNGLPSPGTMAAPAPPENTEPLPK